MKKDSRKALLCLLILGLLLTYYMPANAQNTIDKTTATVETVAKGINVIKGLFGKSKLAKETVRGAAPNAITLGNTLPEGNKSAETVPPNIKNGQQPVFDIRYAGNISPNVKYIDCDLMEPFNMGSAIVKKGDAYALIDTAGNFIVPYNKFKSIYNLAKWISSGIYDASFTINGRETGGFINWKGAILFDYNNANDYAWNRSIDGNFIVLSKQIGTSTAIILIDHTGKKTSLTVPGNITISNQGVESVKDSAIVYENKNLYGFKSFSGENVPATYDLMMPFNNGVAIFGKRNQFNEMKFGIIDRTGKIVLPPTFSVNPKNFSYGILKVYANSSADFVSAFMNTKGEIIFKQTNQTNKDYGVFPAFYESFAYSDNLFSGAGQYLLTKEGKLFKQSDFFSALGLRSGPGQQFSTLAFVTPPALLNDRYQRFTAVSNSTNAKKTYMGLINSRTRTVILAERADVNIADLLIYFDPKARLAYAVIPSGQKNRNNQVVNTEGFINEKGVYVIIKGGRKSDF